jgi:hypothetical protein
MSSTQASALLPSLFERIDEGRRLTVLNIGSALPETVDFFSRYRCKLHFIDVFTELSQFPQLAGEDDAQAFLEQRFASLMEVPPGTQFDICLFWDLFNFMDRASISAFLGTLRVHLHADTMGHGFAVHNLKTPQSGQLYGIRECDQISLRRRTAELPGYTPRNQGQLEKVLDCFSFTRSVLLPESRLEILLKARL